MAQCGIPGTVVAVQGPQASHNKPTESDYAPNSKGYDKRKRTVMVIAGSHRTSGSGFVQATNVRLVGQEQIAGIQSVALAFEKIFGHLWKDHFPHFESPGSGSVRGDFDHGIDLNRQETQG